MRRRLLYREFYKSAETSARINATVPDSISGSGGTITIQNYNTDVTITDYYTDGSTVTRIVQTSDNMTTSVEGATLNSNTSITVAPNPTNKNKTIKITIKYKNMATKDLVITQAAGTVTYGPIVIKSFTVGDIPASGGEVAAGTVAYEQTWGYNGATTGGGTITSGATIGYVNKTDATKKSVSAGNLGTTLKSRTQVGTLIINISLNGKSASAEVAVYQAANTRVLNSISICNSDMETIDNIYVSANGYNPYNDWGDTYLFIGGNYTYTSGSKLNADQINPTDGLLITNITIKDSWIEYKTDNNKKSFVISDETNLGTTIQPERRTIITVTAEGKTASANIIQEANNIKSKGPWNINLSANPNPMPATATSTTITNSATRTLTYTSGATSTENGIPTLTEVADTSNAFTLSGNTVTTTANTGKTERSCTIRATIAD